MNVRRPEADRPRGGARADARHRHRGRRRLGLDGERAPLDVGRPRPDARCLALRARRASRRLCRLLRQGKPTERGRLRPSRASRAGDRLGDPAPDRGAGARGGAERAGRRARLHPERDPRSGRGRPCASTASAATSRCAASAGWRSTSTRSRSPGAVPGIEIRPYRHPDEGRAFHAAQQESFADHWEHRPTAWEKWQQKRYGRETFDPTLWWVAEADGEIAGVLVGRAAARSRPGLDRDPSACGAPTAGAGSRRRS